MYWLYCDYEKKESVFTGINSTENCHCVQCGHIVKRPQPKQEGWTKREKAIWSTLYKLDCLDIPGTIAQLHKRMPEDYTTEEVRQFFSKIDRIGE